MPAKKAGRQSLKRYKRNGSVRTTTRTAFAKALRSVAAGDADAATGTVHEAVRTLDLAVRKGVMHRNAASRRKSRISIRLNRLLGA